MKPTKPIFAFQYEPGLVVLVPQIDLGNLTYHQYQHDLRYALHALAVDQARNVVIDLSKTSYFGSSVLGFFVGVWKITRRSRGTMVMCGLSPFGLEILQIAHLDKVWPICCTRDEAIELVRRVGTDQYCDVCLPCKQARDATEKASP